MILKALLGAGKGKPQAFGYNRKVCPPPLRRRDPYIRSVGVKSPTERQQAYGLPLLVESKAFSQKL